MIIVYDLDGNPVCYLFTREQREAFAAAVPGHHWRMLYRFESFPAFSRDPR